MPRQKHITIRITTDRQPWFDGFPRNRGEELKMPEKEAMPFIEKGFAEIVRGSDDGSESD